MTALVVETSMEVSTCPFCGSADTHIETDTAPNSTYQVLCDNPDCEAEGPNGAKTPEDAVARWNKRAGTAAP